MLSGAAGDYNNNQSESGRNGRRRHINNTFVPMWFEAGREEIFRIFTPDLSFRAWKVALVNIQMGYRRQLFYGQEVLIQTRVLEKLRH
jgi:acyl-CoA thioesterase FadM